MQPFSCSHLLLLLKDIPFLLLGALGLDAPEVLVIELFGNTKRTDVQLGGCGDQVNLVDAAQGASIDLEGA